MPRPERALHPGDDRVTRFAADLRALRENAGRPGYRALAAVAHYSVTTLSEAAGGRQLPTLAVTPSPSGSVGGMYSLRTWPRLTSHRSGLNRTTVVRPRMSAWPLSNQRMPTGSSGGKH
jgi:hypothetical protein